MEFKLENGKTMVVKAVNLSDRYHVESKLGCDVTCSQMCLDLSRNYALAQCFKYCGCESLLFEKNDAIQRPSLDSIKINAWQDVRIDFDLPEQPQDPVTIDAYLPSGPKGNEKYTIQFNPAGVRNGKDHLSVDLPGGPENLPELEVAASEVKTENATTSKLEWSVIDPTFNGQFENVVEQTPGHFAESNVVTVPGVGYEAGVKQDYTFDPQTGTISYDEVVYTPTAEVHNSGSEMIFGNPSQGAAEAQGTLSWDFTKGQHVNAIQTPESSSSGISTLMFQGFFFTVVGAVIYRFVTASRSVAPASESLLSPYQRL